MFILYYIFHLLLYILGRSIYDPFQKGNLKKRGAHKFSCYIENGCYCYTCDYYYIYYTIFQTATTTKKQMK